MSDQPHYPYADGDIAVLGPEVFASADGQTISWKGANYSRHPGEIHCLCGGISVTHEIRGAAEPQDAHDGAQAVQGGSLHAQIVAAVRPWLLGADEADVEHCAAEVVAAILPTTRLLGTLHRAAHDDINRVIDLYGRWVKAGPPPIGTPTARWWDQRLAELHDAVLPPAHDTGPSVAECAKADEEHWNTKYAGEGS